jgi:hypothetical protein
MLVLPPRTIELIAERIERAYRRRHTERYRGGDHAVVWGLVATALIELHRADPGLPLDPELYVAAQRRNRLWADPWQDLVGDEPARRYSRTVRKIIRQLRCELRDELRYASALRRRHGSLETIVSSQGKHTKSISPLGRFIIAHRAGRADLMDRVRSEACDQHWSCPLYRQACASWLAPGAYPVRDVLPFGDASVCTRAQSTQFSLN